GVVPRPLAGLPPHNDVGNTRAGGVARAGAPRPRRGVVFDWVSPAPPYGTDPRAIRSRAESLLDENGLFVFQADRGASPPRLEGLTLVETRDYGRNLFFFFSKDPDTRPSHTARVL